MIWDSSQVAHRNLLLAFLRSLGHLFNLFSEDVADFLVERFGSIGSSDFGDAGGETRRFIAYILSWKGFWLITLNMHATVVRSIKTKSENLL